MLFSNASASPYHTVSESKARLLGAASFLRERGHDNVVEFQELKEGEPWNLEKGKGYFFTRNGSALFAWVVGANYVPGNAFKIIGAHTDFPCLRIKPQSILIKGGDVALGVQPYGGGIWSTWFDRDLSVAGRVVVRIPDERRVLIRNVRINKPIMRVPSLAAHFHFKGDINKESHLIPLLASQLAVDGLSLPSSAEAPHHPLLLHLLSRELACNPEAIVDFDLVAYDTQPAALGGALDEYIFAGHHDNTIMSYLALQALINTAPTAVRDAGVRVCALFDHEEVGSTSAVGASSQTMRTLVRRIVASLDPTCHEQVYERTVANSYLISADVAHAYHPNYSAQHEGEHRCMMNKGPVVKYNANQRYATSLHSALVFSELARLCQVPIQRFVVRNDMPCGSTIGPSLSASCVMRTIDVGNAILSMHSIREQAGAKDLDHTFNIFSGFYEHFEQVEATIETAE